MENSLGIVGAGCAGTMLLVACQKRAEATNTPIHVTVYEQSGVFGPGLAYSTTDAQHLLNVPAKAIGTHIDDPSGFLSWSQTRDAAIKDTAFLPRAWYGSYLSEAFERSRKLIIKQGGSVTLLRREALTINPSETGYTVSASCGKNTNKRQTHHHKHVVLALGNIQEEPAIELPYDHRGRVFSAPWVDGALLASPQGGSVHPTVLLIGTGLTAIDAALSLTAANPKLRVIAVSRSGKLPLAHHERGVYAAWPAPPWASGDMSAPETYRELRKLVLARILDAQTSSGAQWQDVIDGLRPHVSYLWRNLPVSEQAIFLREGLRDWEIRRHRMAPKVAARVERLIAAERLIVQAGAVSDFAATADGIHVVITKSNGRYDRLRADRVIACTGGVQAITQTRMPLLKQLFADGLAQPDAHNIGLRSTESAELLASDEQVLSNLFLIGPLRRGDLLETTGIAEIRAQADALAKQII